MVEFWLIYRASYIKTFEQRNFQAAKDSLIELKLGLKMILKIMVAFIILTTQKLY